MVPFTIRMMFSIASSTRLFPLWIFLCAAYSYAGKIRFNKPSTVAPDYVDEQHNDELILNPCVRVCISTTACLRGNVSVPQNKLCGTTDERQAIESNKNHVIIPHMYLNPHNDRHCFSVEQGATLTVHLKQVDWTTKVPYNDWICGLQFEEMFDVRVFPNNFERRTPSLLVECSPKGCHKFDESVKLHEQVYF